MSTTTYVFREKLRKVFKNYYQIFLDNNLYDLALFHCTLQCGHNADARVSGETLSIFDLITGHMPISAQSCNL